jgi:hypothetical protein
MIHIPVLHVVRCRPHAEMLIEEGDLARDPSLADVPLAGTVANEPVSVTRSSEAKTSTISTAVFAG